MAAVKSGSQTRKYFVANVMKFLLSHVNEKEDDVYLFWTTPRFILNAHYRNYRRITQSPYSPDTNVTESLVHMIKCEARRNPANEIFQTVSVAPIARTASHACAADNSPCRCDSLIQGAFPPGALITWHVASQRTKARGRRTLAGAG